MLEGTRDNHRADRVRTAGVNVLSHRDVMGFCRDHLANVHIPIVHQAVAHHAVACFVDRVFSLREELHGSELQAGCFPVYAYMIRGIKRYALTWEWKEPSRSNRAFTFSMDLMDRMDLRGRVKEIEEEMWRSGFNPNVRIMVRQDKKNREIRAYQSLRSHELIL